MSPACFHEWESLTQLQFETKKWDGKSRTEKLAHSNTRFAAARNVSNQMTQQRRPADQFGDDDMLVRRVRTAADSSQTVERRHT